ncbi:hypothetical protein C7212DRAFT_303145 [Tuber magnatum]|uniref:Crossover junction endonuclease MUS81 n=1 Tax=Tuber magnatum TaxID=42249 RepID=A0A317SBL8_9PEZI|nr:hypothetical protein C7212DRAFT_303145 [Tuber magnatum]
MADDECANPLLLGFLKDWYDTARQQNSKGVTTYRNAYEAMRACPIPFQHPSEAIQLKGFGPVLCERLTQALKLYCEANGLPMPKKAKRRRARSNLDGEENAAGEGEGAGAAPPPKKKRPTKAYIPRKRTGAYALLYALYKGDGDMLTKTELIDRARPYCDASFDAPAEAGKFYTAWASMRTLINNNYVYFSGNPKRYMLTEGGEEVGRGIVAAEEGLDEGVGGGDGDFGEAAQAGGPAARGGATASGSVANPRPKRTPAQAVRDTWSGDGSEDSNDVAPPRRRRRAAQGHEEDNRPTLRRISEEPEANSRAPEDGPELSDCAATLGRNSIRPSRNTGPIDDGGHFSVVPSRSRTPPVAPPPRTSNEIDLTISPEHPSATILRPRSRSSANIPTVSHRENHKVGNITSRASSITSVDCGAPASSRPQSRAGSITAPRAASGSKPTFPDFAPEIVKAGTFTVHLLLDNREVRTKNDRDYIQDNLKACGINPITRPLQVGDAMWIACERGGRNREIVLDHIVERKRLDDLVASIKDGRFHEQKFRLAKSGLKHVTYIIEDFTLKEADRTMQDAMDTAISSTQVVNGFFVKRTGKLDDTIQYLVRMTKKLAKEYETKDLNLIPDNLLDSSTYQAFRKHLNDRFPEKQFNTNYSIFSTLVSKSASLNLRDVYLKMLMCVRGISLEKALRIQKMYPTPIELVEAYERCASEDEMKEMIMKQFANVLGRKKVGPAISAKVAEVWTGVGAQEDPEEAEDSD